MEDRFKELEFDISHIKRSLRDTDDRCAVIEETIQFNKVEFMGAVDHLTDSLDKMLKIFFAIKWSVIGGLLLVSVVNAENLSKVFLSLVKLIAPI